MTLNDYLKGKNADDFAEKVGINRSYLSLIRRGHKTPSVKTARAISEATGGEVLTVDLLGLGSE